MAQADKNGSTNWDLEADVLVIGSGAAGLPAAIKAIEGDSSVIVVEANYDVGGHAILSGGHMALGGGTSLQKRYGVADSADQDVCAVVEREAAAEDIHAADLLSDQRVVRLAEAARGALVRVAGVDGVAVLQTVERASGLNRRP